MAQNREERINSNVIKELAKIRKELGISKKSLSEESGLSRRGIQLIEEEQRNPTMLSLLKMAHALNRELGSIIATVESQTN